MKLVTNGLIKIDTNFRMRGYSEGSQMFIEYVHWTITISNIYQTRRFLLDDDSGDGNDAKMMTIDKSYRETKMGQI